MQDINNARVVIVGAGAAGLMAAHSAAQKGLSVLLLEKNGRPARKLMITGKGRCNVTNDCSLDRLMDAVPRNGRFLYAAFARYTPQDAMAFLETGGVPLKIERGNRVFPVSDRASDVVDALVSATRKVGVQFRQAAVQELILEDGVVTGVRTQDGNEIQSKAVIVCTGGKSYPLTGSTGDGYRWARQAGHQVTPLLPSLVPLETLDAKPQELQGLSLKNIAITVTNLDNHKVIYQDFGEMLFTHFGLSGPVILSASAHMRPMQKGQYQIHIDLKPALTSEQLDLRLQRDFQKYANREFANTLSDLLPRKMIPYIVALSGIAPESKAHQITREMRIHLGKLLKALPFTVQGFRPIEEAIITAGGVATREINPSTMESKLVRGLYFAGEILDVDAYTGGFNLQIAFSTGFLAGSSVNI